MKPRFYAVILPLITILLMLTLVQAFEVSSPYWEGNPLQLNPGESEIVTLNLQNIANAQEDINAEVRITEGSDIASLAKEVYTVKAGESENCFLMVNLPSDAVPGEIYKIKVETKTANPSTTGMIAIGTGMATSFDVIVTASENQTSSAWLYAIIATIVIAILYFIVIAKRK